MRIHCLLAAVVGAFATLTTMQTELSSSPGSWFQGRIEKLHSAPEGSDLRSELHDLFTDHPHIVLNHKPISVSDFRAHFASRRFAVVDETVDWKHVVHAARVDTVEEEDKNKNEDTRESEEEEEETVAGSYIVTRSLKFRIRAAPAQRESHVAFSAKVNSRPGEGRRISELYMTMVDKAVPVSLTALPTA